MKATLTALAWSFLVASACASSYSELLELAPLGRSSLQAAFSFHSDASLDSFEQQHFRFLPRALSQILQYSNTKELHLRFGSGRWDEQQWGPLPRNGSRSGGTGVELWAWVEADSAEEAESRWLALTNSLSGLFCASLNFIDATRTLRPVDVFPPEGSLPETSTNLHLLHGQLARETVCTENLTPFLKFIPCKGKSGISSLFDGHKLFDSQWQAMSVDVKTVCDVTGQNCTVVFDQTVDLVLDIERSQRPKDDPIPRPAEKELLPCDTSKFYHEFGDSCFPMRSDFVPSFNISDIFGRKLRGSCPLAAPDGQSVAPAICFDVSSNPTLRVSTNGKYKEEIRKGGRQRCFTMPIGEDFDISMEQLPVANLAAAEPVPIQVERAFSGLGQERGGSRTVFTNPSPDRSVSLVYLESLPWFIKPYLHTLDAKVASNLVNTAEEDEPAAFDPLSWLSFLSDGEAGEDTGIPSANAPASSLISNLHYLPSVDRERGTHLELSLAVPPASTLTLSYDFDKSVLRYTEYPPDPNRGFDIPPAVIRIVPSLHPSAESDAPSVGEYSTRTNSLLIYLPTPDFSMPYNVIILTSTVIALAFGSMFNIIVRRFVGVDEVEGGRGGLIRILIRRIVTKLQERFSKDGAEKKRQ